MVQILKVVILKIYLLQGHANVFPIVSLDRAVTDYRRRSCRPACVGVRVKFRFWDGSGLGLAVELGLGLGQG